MRNILLNGVWVAVVLSGLGIVVFRFDEYGVWGVGAIAIGMAMLVIFAIAHLKEAGRSAQRVSDYATGAAILGAILVLVVSLVESIRRMSIIAAIILALFLSAFVRIFRDYVRHLKKGRQAERNS
jgi:hypothetical protein